MHAYPPRRAPHGVVEEELSGFPALVDATAARKDAEALYTDIVLGVLLPSHADAFPEHVRAAAPNQPQISRLVTTPPLHAGLLEGGRALGARSVSFEGHHGAADAAARRDANGCVCAGRVRARQTLARGRV